MKIKKIKTKLGYFQVVERTGLIAKIKKIFKKRNKKIN